RFACRVPVGRFVYQPYIHSQGGTRCSTSSRSTRTGRLTGIRFRPTNARRSRTSTWRSTSGRGSSAARASSPSIRPRPGGGRTGVHGGGGGRGAEGGARRLLPGRGRRHRRRDRARRAHAGGTHGRRCRGAAAGGTLSTRSGSVAPEGHASGQAFREHWGRVVA